MQIRNIQNKLVKMGGYLLTQTNNEKDKLEALNSRNDVRIGARILSKEELKKRLDNYENIFNQIDVIRDVAKEFNVLMKNKDGDNKRNKLLSEREFNKHYNNIFSILGDRGFGKTSVLMTLKYMLMTDEFGSKEDGEQENKCNVNNKDMFLPVIVPEDMENTSDVLGWLIGYLGDVVIELDKQVKLHATKLSHDNEMDKYFDTCRKFKDKTFKTRFEDLQTAYAKRTKEYSEILKDTYSGINEYVEGKSQALTSDQQLMTKFQEFWDELLFVKRKINGMSIEPLLFVFFDDVDISTQRCFEVLNTAMRYLSYPNIVVFMCGDYKMFSETLTIDILKKDGLINNGMKESYLLSGEESALDLRKQLARDYLIKMMPPAYRYILPVYTDKMKAEFTYTTEADNRTQSENEKHYTFYELLKVSFVKDDNSNFMILPPKTGVVTKSSRGVRVKPNKINEQKDNIIYSFFKIFPDNPRGLMNVYQYLHTKVKDIQKQKNKKTIYENWNGLELRQLLNTIVDSSSTLSLYKDRINQVINIDKEKLDKSFIGYDYLLNFFEESINMEHITGNDEQKLKDDYITICILAHFFECIIYNICPNDWGKVHGKSILYNILKRYQNKFSMYPRIENNHNAVKWLLKLHELITEGKNTKYSNLLDSEDKKHYIKIYFEQLLKLTGDKEDFVSFMHDIALEDYEWVRHKIDIIMKHAGGERLILKIKKNELIKKLYNKYEIENIQSHHKEVISSIIQESDLSKYIDKSIYNQEENSAGLEISKNISKKFEEYIKNVRISNGMDLDGIIDERSKYSKIYSYLLKLDSIIEKLRFYDESKEMIETRDTNLLLQIFGIENISEYSEVDFEDSISRIVSEEDLYELFFKNGDLEKIISAIDTEVNYPNRKSLWNDAMRNRIISYDFEDGVEDENYKHYHYEQNISDYLKRKNLPEVYEKVFDSFCSKNNKGYILKLKTSISGRMEDTLKEYFDSMLYLQDLKEIYNISRTIAEHYMLIEMINDLHKSINKVIDEINSILGDMYSTVKKLETYSDLMDFDTELVKLIANLVAYKQGNDFENTNEFINELSTLEDKKPIIESKIRKFSELSVFVQINNNRYFKYMLDNKKDIPALNQLFDFHNYIISDIKIKYLQLNYEVIIDIEIFRELEKYIGIVPDITIILKTKNNIIKAADLEKIIDDIVFARKNAHLLFEEDDDNIKSPKSKKNEIGEEELWDIEEKLKSCFDYYDYKVQKIILRNQLEKISVGHILVSAMIEISNMKVDEGFYKLFKDLKQDLLEHGKNTLLQSYLHEYRDESK